MDNKESLQRYLHALNFTMKPVTLPGNLCISETNQGGAVAGHASPLALSPNLPNIVKVEPRLPTSCVGNTPDAVGGSTFYSAKRLRQDNETWVPSPSQMSMGSLSPSLYLNGHSVTTSNGLSPISVGSDDGNSLSGKEELSPPTIGINGCYVDSCGDFKKKTKGPAPRQQEELCLVCGDRASGYHYNALTCEGCKGFFRRSITRNAVYQCKYGNNCEIDMYMRRKCQECRLKKCLNVGMRPECVVPEYQCAIKRESKKVRKDKDKPNSTTKDSTCEKDEKPSQVKPLEPSQEDVINKLVLFQEEFESPSQDDLRKISTFPTGDSEEDNLQRFQHITEITILTVQLIVEFSKRVPGFDTLLREDQITLLKACSSEVMMLRTARKYDGKTDSIVFANNQPYTRENYRSASIGDSADALFSFCRKMCILKVTNAEYALLTAIVIFSERPHLLEPKKVEKIQEFYIDALRTYVDNFRPPGKNYFAKLLSVLTELRTLGNMNSEMCFSLKVQNKKLPPFLAEIWDVME
ncbi:ecdysone receptor-like isoform X1 [Tachypleus tridentatus]|uniref:ecdysone receptor-like isoform X1 n=1 Tax=Tachypleus tridentatus TaxID=6853 RepID=UPI003FD1F521